MEEVPLPAFPLLRHPGVIHSTSLLPNWIETNCLAALRTHLWSHEVGSYLWSLHSPLSGPRFLLASLGFRLPSPADRCAKKVDVRAATPTCCPASTVLVRSPSRSHLCEGRTGLIPGYSLYFLCPNFQQPMRPQCYAPGHPKLGNCWQAGKTVVLPRELDSTPEHGGGFPEDHFPVVEWTGFHNLR